MSGQTLTHKIKDFFSHPIVAAVAASFIISFFSFIGNLLLVPHFLTEDINETVASSINENLSNDRLEKLKNDIKKDYEKQINNLEGNLKEDYDKQIEALKENYNNQIKNLKDDIDKLDDRVYNLKPTPITTNCIYIPNQIKESYLTTSPTWKLTDIIAEDKDTQETFSAKQLANEKILLPYKENGQEVYFLGQYDKKIRWHGDCIINVYNDKNELILITEANYSHGKLIKYQQVFQSHDNRWFISKRVHNDDVNTGETWSYEKKNDYTKNFNLDTVESNQILSIKTFKKGIKTSWEGHYIGNTSDGEYNDDTGNAILIKRFSDKTMKTFYKGRFKDGVFHDKTNKAWSITIDEKDLNYAYFKGNFENGDRCESSKNRPRIIENNDIRKKINKLNLKNIKIILRKTKTA